MDSSKNDDVFEIVPESKGLPVLCGSLRNTFLTKRECCCM
jgi:hypothetical protein